MRVLLAVVLLAPFAASGQDAASETGRIVGGVTDAETGDPLIGATVWLVGTTLGAATDLDGRFAIEGVPVGEHEVRASYVGFEAAEVRVRVAAGGTVAFHPALRASGGIACDLGTCVGPPLLTSSIYQARVVAGPGASFCEPVRAGETFVAAR